MLAHNQGTTINASQLANNLDISSVTVARYLDLMVDLLLVRRLKPWISNIGKRLVKTPKVYVRDNGLTHTLLNISNYNDLLGHPIIGTSWEGFVIENIMAVIPSGMIMHLTQVKAQGLRKYKHTEAYQKLGVANTSD